MIRAALASAARRLRGHRRSATDPGSLAGIPVAAKRVLTIAGADEFRTTLLQLIQQAGERILIAALYLQDDEAGREVLDALHAARAASPGLQIAVFVDWHRAQRGLVGEARSAGNAALYVAMARRLGPGVPIYGVPVHTREWMGVMHLKGFIIDDRVLYSGASLNDVYLHRGDRYRLDRYHLIESRPLADSMAALLTRLQKENAAVSAVDRETRPGTRSLSRAIGQFRRWLAHSRYPTVSGRIGEGEVAITPLLGFGARDNPLNATILRVIQHARRHLLLFTPYFNLPGAVRGAIGEKLRQGCRVTIVVGDKTANDFYIAPDQPFTTIGALPYLYEANLRRFCKAHQPEIDQDLLELYLWRHDPHTFHLKGLLADGGEYALLTGSNLNPRAWRLDLENGLLIDDPQGCLRDQHAAELERILRHARRLDHHSALEALDSYPAPVQRILKRLTRTRTDRLLNQVL
ncbi:MAG: CDP-diacylglycerol--serine O-phosphatidyltransferase [Candidatus Accumulibacter sp. UW20]|jgi:CDP-diacylglycerol--serine O-phosphatidyltransferase